MIDTNLKPVLYSERIAISHDLSNVVEADSTNSIGLNVSRISESDFEGVTSSFTKLA